MVEKLVSPVILGLDFFYDNNLVIDFSSLPPQVYRHTNQSNPSVSIPSKTEKICMIVGSSESKTNNDCAIPVFSKTPIFELPQCSNGKFKRVIEKYKNLFRTSPGFTQECQHNIIVTDTPVKIPPRRIPVHFKEEVQ